MPRLCELYIGICLTPEEKHGKTSVRLVEECSSPCHFQQKQFDFHSRIISSSFAVVMLLITTLDVTVAGYSQAAHAVA